MTDIHGQAILDYYMAPDNAQQLLLHNSYGDVEEMPVEVFFREEQDLSVLEHLAIIESKGAILDVGAGAGAISLVLESYGKDVTALELSAACVKVMQMSGLSKVIQGNYEAVTEKYDTLLLLMNGLGLAGQLSGLKPFLLKCMSLLKPGGQILADSSDITYLYEDGLEKPTGYFGDLSYRYEYKGALGRWFDWLYIDPDTLMREGNAVGVDVEILHKEDTDQYLASLVKA